MVKYVERGYGQVEPNHLSAQRTAQIYAQLPMGTGVEKLENGQFVKYDYAAGEVNFAGEGEWMLVYNEVKVYDARETDADFAMIGAGKYPRVFKTNIGDIFTTNCVEEETLKVEDVLTPNAANGILRTVSEGDGEGIMKWQVVKVYTLADGQQAVKIMRIA